MPSQGSQRRGYNSKDKFTSEQIAAQLAKSLANLPRKKGNSIKKSLVVPVANALYSLGDTASRMASRSTRSKRGGRGKGSRKKRRTSRSSASDAQR
jgi:hypothetical protein